ncbi:peptidase [Micromonospora sp. HM5-17]|uniref:peptidase n=1 Tax=Micromonospora sp. HM5-17 TaxID=2487710 RepID=UPI001F3F87B2|nr:peptidase [Micromonospora sp. HM5-17]
MGRGLLRRAAPSILAVAASVLLPAVPATAAPTTPTPSPGAVTVTKAGTSFLTATAIGLGQPVKVPASLGDYLYWSFPGSAGETNEVAITVALPPGSSRHGAATWTVDVFDGLRRRQACTAGAQTPTAGPNDAQVTLGCRLRTVRPWAEPWSGDPLPGTYYVRLSVTDLPEEDLGLPVRVELLVSTIDDTDTPLEDGDLKAPLVPATEPGKVLTGATPDATPAPGASGRPELAAGEDDDDGWFDGWFEGWFDGFSSRWIWTSAGGVLAAIAGVVGFGLTRRPRRPVR